MHEAFSSLDREPVKCLPARYYVSLAIVSLL